MQTKIIIICGLTALNKTYLAIACAKDINGIAINCDPFQSYSQLSAGVNKHQHNLYYDNNIYLSVLDNINATSYNLHLYQKITKYSEKYQYLFLVTGNPFYLKQFLLKNDEQVTFARNKFFENFYNDYTNQNLHELLACYDKEASKWIHVNNRQKILRALHINIVNNQNWILQKEINYKKKYDNVTIFYRSVVLDDDYKAQLKQRVIKMLTEEGWCNEVRALVRKYKLQTADFTKYTSLKACGYLTIFKHLFGEYHTFSFNELINKLVIEHYQMAKKQKKFFSNFVNSFPYFSLNGLHFKLDFFRKIIINNISNT